MKISKTLMQAASFNPTEKSHKMTVLDMCRKTIMSHKCRLMIEK